jgi:hypothetical protein
MGSQRKLDMKNNIFLFTPGGYGPHSRIHFWAAHIEPENIDDDDDDGWIDAAHEYVDEHAHDVDYGCYFMSRKDAEKIVEDLKKLLEEEHE